MVAKKRESVLMFANTAAAGAEAAEYQPMNIGFNTADETLNLETSDKQYIGQTTSTTVVNSLNPNIAYNMNIEAEDPVVQIFYDCHKNHIVDKTIEIIAVFTFETAEESGYPAIKRTYKIQPETGGFAGNGGEEMELTGNLAEEPDSSVQGTFDTTTRTFTPAAA